MRVLFLGPSPSKKNTDPRIPFVGTKSLDRIFKWAEYLGLETFRLENISQSIAAKKFSSLEVARARDIARWEADKVISLGEQVCKILSWNVDHFNMPNPSSRNKKLNDKAYEKKMLDECRKYLYGEDKLANSDKPKRVRRSNKRVER